MSELLAAWVPGLPHVLSAEKSTRWAKLEKGFQELGKKTADLKPDAIVLYSTQWLSVLGTSFQVRPELKGVHVDENWYELGDLEFDFASDVELGKSFAASATDAGFPTKLIDYEEFPIDTGTIVALNYLNPVKKIPVSIVSSWVYADAGKSRQLGEVMAETVKRSGKRVLFVASSLLSTRFFTDEINPEDDKVSHASDEAWNQRVLELFESGKLSEVTELKGDTKGVPLDMQFNAFHWLTGVLGKKPVTGKVLSYGPQWGTGAAVVEFMGEKR